MEQVDILLPPTFKKSGVIKSRKEAIEDGDWIGTFNLWIVQTDPVPALIYQQRSPNSTWAPNKLDVSAGGHYQAGETMHDGLREVQEELGRTYRVEDLTYMGRKLFVGPDIRGKMRNNVVDIFFVLDNSPLNTFALEENEVFAVVTCPLDDLLQVHSSVHSFQAQGFTNKLANISITVDKNSFPYNWDNYLYKVALLAQRYIAGEKKLLY